MSQKKKFQIQCPKCHASGDIELYDSINVQTHPELRDELMSNRLNAVACPACAFGFRVEKSLLYHDPGRDLMIYWIPTGPEARGKGQEEFRDTITRMSSIIPDTMDFPSVNLVFTRTELVERIFICETGLNVRIIEYMKYMLYLKDEQLYPPASRAILFNAEDSTTDQLCFVIQDAETQRFDSVLSYQRDAYEALVEMFDRDDQTSTLLELFPGPYISARALLLEEAKVSGG